MTKRDEAPQETGTDLAVPLEQIQQSIHTIRGQRVMLDSDLARLYGVETKALNQAVKRNSGRFPADFMFQLTPEEQEALRSQTVTAKPEWNKKRYPPYAFTEQGVAMLSSVLRSERAVQVNVAIMRAFVALRGMMLSDSDLARKLLQMEQKYDAQFRVVFEAIRQLIEVPPPPDRKMGFRAPQET